MRRIVCLLLALVMVVSLVPLAAVTANAASSMTTSEDAIKILKKMETYKKYAYKDNTQWSIGYGTACGQNEYPNGISEAKADELLREELLKVDKDLNAFIDRYGLKFTQNKFDALALFSYNAGTAWMKAEGRFRQSVIDGDTGNDLLYTMTLWSNISGVPSLGLINRRLAEADMYLNGSYVTPGKQRSNYTYVMLNNNGGVNEDEVQGYDSNIPTTVKPVPTKAGYRFLGWYTAANGGTWVTTLTAETAKKTLYAHWQKDSDDAETTAGTPASYKCAASSAASLNVYETPGSTAKVIDTLTAAQTLEIVAEYVDGKENKWGKLASGGWVDLGSATDPIFTGINVEVTVTNNYVNVRSAAGAFNAKLGQVNKGDKLVITELTTVDGNKWGRISVSDAALDGGWVALMYTDFDEALENSGSESDEVIATGKVSCSDYLNVRSGAGVSYAQVGSLVNGTSVKIYQITEVDGHDWGRIYSGWICLDYVILDKEAAGDSTEPGDKEETPAPETTIATGTVKVSDVLNVRSGPGVNYNKVGTLPNGTKVSITAMKTVNGHIWGKIDIGWICLTYVVLDTIDLPEASDPTEPGETDPTEPEDTKPTEPGETDPTEPGETDPTEPGETKPTEPEAPKATTGVVANTNVVNVREAAGCRNDIVTTLKRGDKVTVYEQVTVDNAPWARIDQGWICMYYVQLDQKTPDEIVGSGDPVTATGTVNSNIALNIRSGPGTNYAKVGALARGTVVEIYEQTTANGMLWGRIDQGWICLSYVVINSSGSGSNENGQMGTVVRCFSALNIRSAPGTFNALVGTIRVNSRVEIYEIVDLNGDKWGRIDQGWVSMYYILLDSELPPVPGLPEETDPTEPEVTEPSEPEVTEPTEPEETEPTEPEVTEPTEPEVTEPTEPEVTEPTEPEETEPTEPEETDPTEPEVTDPTEPETGDGEQVIEYLTGTVVNAPQGLKVRANAGTHYDQVGTVANGTKIKIYDLEIVNGLAWGKIDQGWVCLSYVSLDPVSEYGVDMRIISSYNVKPRISADANAETTKGVDEEGNVVELVFECGAIVEIYEIKKVGNATWGLTLYGWINYADTQNT